MQPTASIIVPTRRRAGYLDVALASIAPQASAAGAELLVVDDGPDAATRAAAQRHGARYVAHERSRGLNAARNTGIDAADADLLVFVDDDVDARPGWLAALLAADAQAAPEVGVLTGPIHARFEDHRWRSCGRELPPITTQDHGAHDRDVEHAWGANMTVRRSAITRAGRFDEARELYGDEQEWQGRLRAAGGRIRYVAAAALDHRRAGDDARLRALAAAAYRRGTASRRFDVFKRRAPVAALRAARAGRLRRAHPPLRVPERDRAHRPPARAPARRGRRARRRRRRTRPGLPLRRERHRARAAPPAAARCSTRRWTSKPARACAGSTAPRANSRRPPGAACSCSASSGRAG